MRYCSCTPRRIVLIFRAVMAICHISLVMLSGLQRHHVGDHVEGEGYRRAGYAGRWMGRAGNGRSAGEDGAQPTHAYSQVQLEFGCVVEAMVKNRERQCQWCANPG